MTIRNLNLFLLILLSSSIEAFYLPSLSSNVFCRNSIPNSACKTKVEVFAKHLDSLQSVEAYEYAYFDFCSITDQSSSYKFDFLRNDDCHIVCRKKFTTSNTNQQKMLKRLMKGIVLNYQQHWIIDNIPIKLCYKYFDGPEFCSRGFPIGCYVTKSGQSKESCNIRNGENDTFYIFNHLDFEITYHSGQGEDDGRIIAVKVQVNSLSSDKCDRNAEPLTFQSTTKDVEIPYTYSVKFVRNNNIRQQEYIRESSSPKPIQQFSILNLSVIILLFSTVFSMIMLNVLHKDIVRCAEITSDMNKNNGEKNFRKQGYVLRPRGKHMFLSIGIMSSVILILTSLGFLSFLSPEALIIYSIVCYILSSTSAGQKIVIITAMTCPGIVFAVLFVLNRFYWMDDSLVAIPFTNVLVLAACWFSIIIELIFTRIYLSFSRPILKNPVQTSQVSEQTLYTKLIPGILMGDILPFGCIFIQVFFILSSIWTHSYHCFIGFLLVVYIILIITCSETTILLCYFLRYVKNYHCWRRLFLTIDFIAIYLFLYSIYYFAIKLELSDGVSLFLHPDNTSMLIVILFLINGIISFLACFLVCS